MFSESLTTSNSSELEELISDIDTFTQTSEEVTPTTSKQSGEDADFLANYYNIDDFGQTKRSVEGIDLVSQRGSHCSENVRYCDEISDHKFDFEELESGS